MKKMYLSAQFSCVSDHFFSFMLEKDPENCVVGFIATAACFYDDQSWVEDRRNEFLSRGCQLKEIDLKNYGQGAKNAKNEEDLMADLIGLDILFMCGGNTFVLLDYAKKSGLYDFLDAYLEENDVWYIGSSAGSVLCCPTIEAVRGMDHPEQAPDLIDFRGLGFVDSVIIPHWGREKYDNEYHDRVDGFWQENNHFLLLSNYHVLCLDANGERVLDTRK